VPNTVFTEVDCDENGDPAPPAPDPTGKRYVAVSADIKVTDPTTGCTATLNGVFTFNPTDTSCRGD
jgi:hypothetical protein